MAMVEGKSKGQGGSPKDIIMENYPTTAAANFEGVHDSMNSTDEQMNADVKLGGRAKTKY